MQIDPKLTEWDGPLFLKRYKYYYGDTLALVIEDESSQDYATISVNLDHPLQNEFSCFIDTNNCPWAERLLKEMKVGQPTGIYVESGFCEYPLYFIDIEKIPEGGD